MPEPRTFLHHASAEAKQLWVVGVLLVMAGASSPAMRLAVVALLAAATAAALPRRLWEPQLKRLGGFCAILFLLTAVGGWRRGTTGRLRAALARPHALLGVVCRARGLQGAGAGSAQRLTCDAPVQAINASASRGFRVLRPRPAAGSDGIAPVLSDRSVPAVSAAAAGAAAASSAAAAGGAGAAASCAAAAATLPASMAGLGPKFRYVLLKLGPITVTRKGLNLAVRPFLRAFFLSAA